MNKRGFTLVELMIVVAIVAIMVSLGVRAFIGSAERKGISDIKVQIPTFFRTILEKAHEFGNTYVITYDSSDTSLKGGVQNVSEKYYTLKLPSSLSYSLVPSQLVILDTGIYNTSSAAFVFTVKTKTNKNVMKIQGKNIIAAEGSSADERIGMGTIQVYYTKTDGTWADNPVLTGN